MRRRIILRAMLWTRRDFARLALTSLPAARLLARPSLAFAQPNSKFAGVQVGMNVPYNFGGRDMDADDLLARCVRLNVSAIELRSQPVEGFLGSPASGGNKVSADTIRKWRSTVSMDRVKAFRKKYEDAGVAIGIVKYDGIYDYSDAELDYSFELARTLGARAISCEIDVEKTRRLGRFADKHQMPVGLHGHGATTPAHWATAFGFARYNWANLDLGHFLAGNNTSPVPFLQQYHDRITHIHVKDRKLHDGATTPFGEGDTPIKEALRLIRDRKWPIQATIEFEYPVPAGSDRMTELAKCVEYCKDALLT
jgi:sugar phosphate isomerase/epimerase